MNESKKKKFIIVLPILVGTVLLVGISYAWLMLTLNGESSNAVKGGNLSLVLDDTMTKGIQIEGALPMSDEVGKRQDPYHFTLTNNGTVSSKYTIYLDEVEIDDGEEKLAEELIKIHRFKHEVYDLTDKISDLKAGDQENSYIIDEGYIYPDKTYEFDIRLWLDSEITDPTLIAGKIFKGKIRVEGEQLQPTPEYCFKNGYLCYEGNPDGLPVITDVVFPERITGTGIDSTYANKGITNLYLPPKFDYWSWNAFAHNKISGALVIPDSVTGAGGKTAPFQNNQIETVEISKNMTTLPRDFVANNRIRSVIIPDNIISIEDNAFGSNQLTSVTIKGKNGISEFKSLGNNVFGWAPGSNCAIYYNAHKTEEYYGLDHNPCIHFEP